MKKYLDLWSFEITFCTQNKGSIFMKFMNSISARPSLHHSAKNVAFGSSLATQGKFLLKSTNSGFRAFFVYMVCV